MAQQPKFGRLEFGISPRALDAADTVLGEPSTLLAGKATTPAVEQEAFMILFTNAANYDAYNVDPRMSDLSWSETYNRERHCLPTEGLRSKSFSGSAPTSFVFGTKEPSTLGTMQSLEVGSTPALAVSVSRLHSEPSHPVAAAQPVVKKRALSVECTHEQLVKRLRGEQHASPASTIGSAGRRPHRGVLGHNWAECKIEDCPLCPAAAAARCRDSVSPSTEDTLEASVVDTTPPTVEPSTVESSTVESSTVESSNAALPTASSASQDRSVNKGAGPVVDNTDGEMYGAMNPARAAFLRNDPPSPPPAWNQQPVDPRMLRGTKANLAPLGSKRVASSGPTSHHPVANAATPGGKRPSHGPAASRKPQPAARLGQSKHNTTQPQLPLPQIGSDVPARPPGYTTPARPVDLAGEMKDRGANDNVVDVIHNTLGIRMVHPKQLELMDKIIAAVQELSLRGYMPLPREQNLERLISASIAAELMCPWLDYIGPQDSAAILRRADELRNYLGEPRRGTGGRSHARSRQAPGG